MLTKPTIYWIITKQTLREDVILIYNCRFKTNKLQTIGHDDAFWEGPQRVLFNKVWVFLHEETLSLFTQDLISTKKCTE